MFQDSPQPNIGGETPARLSARFWALVPLTGIGAGLCGGLLMLLLRWVQHVSWSYRAGEFLDAVKRVGPDRRVAVVVAAGVLVAIVLLLRRLGPGGHGGEVNAAIWFRAGRLSPLDAALKAVLSIVIVGMGASLGREAAPKQAGALVADLLSGWTGLPDGQRRLLVACGAGAGMAAVYNVPFGGALFALEVLLGSLALPLVAPALATSFIAVAVSWLMLPNQSTYSIPFYRVTAGQLLWALLFGPIAGLGSVLYIRLISWADARKPKGVTMAIAPIAVFAVLGGLAVRFPELLGNGKNVTQEALLGQIAVPLILALVVLKPALTAACLGSGAPGGLFTPTMTYGALLGGVLGEAWRMIWPGAESGSYALIGAAAVLAASMQAPIAAMALMAELTDRLDTMMIPVLVAVTGAVMVTRWLEPRSIYSGRIHAGRAATGAADRREETISAAARYAELLHRLLQRGDRPLRVVDNEGNDVGQVSREAAMHPDASMVPLETATAADFVRE